MSASHVLRWVGGQSFVAAPVNGAPTLLRFDSDDFMDRLLVLLADAPQTVNEAPFSGGWLFRIRLADPAQLAGLLTASDYTAGPGAA